MAAVASRLPLPLSSTSTASLPNLTPSTTDVFSAQERLSMEQVLLRNRWSTHCVSALYHFHRSELSSYAHELVKVMRDSALATYGLEFGYSVSIRKTAAFVAFQLEEDRDGLQTPLEADRSRAVSSAPGLPPTGVRRPSENQRRGIEQETKLNSVSYVQQQQQQRKCGFVLHFPESEEERMTQSFRRSKENSYVLLLRGSEELMQWACTWIQRRFQCIVAKQVVRVNPINMKLLAANLVTDALQQDARVHVTPDASSSRPNKAPLLLKYVNINEQAAVRTYTLTVPWKALQRLSESTPQNAKKDPSSFAPLPPPTGTDSACLDCSRWCLTGFAVDELNAVERLYFDALPFDTSEFELRSIELDGVAVRHGGIVEVHELSCSCLAGRSSLVLTDSLVSSRAWRVWSQRSRDSWRSTTRTKQPRQPSDHR